MCLSGKTVKKLRMCNGHRSQAAFGKSKDQWFEAVMSGLPRCWQCLMSWLGWCLPESSFYGKSWNSIYFFAHCSVMYIKSCNFFFGNIEDKLEIPLREAKRRNGVPYRLNCILPGFLCWSPNFLIPNVIVFGDGAFGR